VAEAARLVNLHTTIVANTLPPSAAADQPHAAWDASGALLAQLQLLRRARLAAIELQLQHLTEHWGIDEPELEAAADAALVQSGGGAAATSAGLAAQAVETAAGTGGNSSPWQRLLGWLRQFGGQANVDVVDAGPERGRIVVARQALAAGQLLAAIPLDMTWSVVQQGGNQSLEVRACMCMCVWCGGGHGLWAQGPSHTRMLPLVVRVCVNAHSSPPPTWPPTCLRPTAPGAPTLMPCPHRLSWWHRCCSCHCLSTATCCRATCWWVTQAAACA
jgi:hypothetical protein